MPSLKGIKVAILITDGFEQVEMVGPRRALDLAPARIAATNSLGTSDGADQVFQPALRHDDVGADVGIVVRRHRGHRSPSRKNFPTAKLRCADINYAKACRGEGRAFNKHLILLRDR